MLSVALLLYAFTFLTSMAILQALSGIDAFESLFFRTLTGGSISTLTLNYVDGVKPFLSFLEACANGDFDLGGYFALIGFIVMLFVWAYNLFTTRSVIVQ